MTDTTDIIAQDLTEAPSFHIIVKKSLDDIQKEKVEEVIKLIAS